MSGSIGKLPQWINTGIYQIQFHLLRVLPNLVDLQSNILQTLNNDDKNTY